jgi:hypothetical protein
VSGSQDISRAKRACIEQFFFLNDFGEPRNHPNWYFFLAGDSRDLRCSPSSETQHTPSNQVLCNFRLDRPDRLESALFGNRGTTWTPAQSVAIVCSTTRDWSGRSGTTPWITMSVARPNIVYHQVCATTMSSLLGNP